MKYILPVILFLGFVFLYYFQNSHSLQNQSAGNLPSLKSAVITSSQSNGTCKARYLNSSDSEAVLPDPSCTPGVINPNVNQENIYTTICKSGYSSTIRPPVSYTNKLKREQIAEYGYLDNKPSDYEEDHFISLELGGSPTDPKNLWPEPHSSPNEKDLVENYLHKQVCSNAISLSQAQQEITTNWYSIYQQIK